MREMNSMRLPRNRYCLPIVVAVGLIGTGLIPRASRSADDLDPIEAGGQATPATPTAVTAPPPLTDTQVQSLKAALEAGLPPAVDTVIQKVNQTARSRVAYTSLVRRFLSNAISKRDLPELQSLPSPADKPAADVVKALTAAQVEKILKDQLSKLTGTTPPPDLPRQVVKRNALAAVQLKATPPRLQLGAGQNLPTPSLPKFDWREKGRIVQDSGIVTVAQDQSTPVSCGCCWAFATIGALEASYAKNNLLLIGASEQYLLNCAGDSLRSTINTSWSCDGGWWAFDLLTVNNGVVATPGAPNRSDLQFTGVQAACQDGLTRPWKVLSWGYVSSGGANAIPSDDDLRQALCQYGPLAVAVKADQLTWMGNAGDVIQDFTNDPNASVNHAILLVGWDNSKNAWIFKNSWGPWGIQDSGFGYVGYGCNNIGWGAAWVIAAPN